MKVLLIQIDGRLPNIALNKIALYYAAQGADIAWNMPLALDQADKVFVSAVFEESRPQVENLKGLRPDLIAGGTGWDYSVKLPAEIDEIKARINYGFTSRGCVRHCGFCLVPRAEGRIRATGDIYDLWDGRSRRITLFDNNILALPDHFERIIGQIAKERLKVDFNQGLDIRLLTPDQVALLKTVRRVDLRFAFDDPALGDVIEQKVPWIRDAGMAKDIFFYVLVGYDTTFDQDLARLDLLRRLGCRAYVMRYKTVALPRGKKPTPEQRRYIRLAEWANMHWSFARFTFDEFVKFKEKGGNHGSENRNPLVAEASVLGRSSAVPEGLQGRPGKDHDRGRNGRAAHATTPGGGLCSDRPADYHDHADRLSTVAGKGRIGSRQGRG